jgi:HD-like signal output (HDOD) protein/prolyl-tRNA editing enzyme YbaK/EbsC (Cys-tRNA(Pro) deacylase)
MIPAAVQKVFEQYQNSQEDTVGVLSDPEVVERQGIAPQHIVKMVLMNDTLGRLQVIFPANCMLDVDLLNKTLGRSLVALPSDDLNSLMAQHSLTELPAIADITGLPAIVDTRISALTDIYVDAGESDKLIKLSKAFFDQSTAKAKSESFTVPLSNIPYNQGSPDNDITQINQAIEKFTTLRIKKRLEDTLEIPPLPQSAHDIITLRSNPDASGEELANIIERDPSLSAQVVSWASSSFYNAPGTVRSVHDAIIRVLGFDMVMNLSMGLSLGRTLNLPSDAPEGYSPYWHQAMWTALGTTSLISKIEPAYRPSFGLSYLSGLLHNFGYLVLAHVFPPHFSLICRYIEANPHLDSSVIEHFLLGITKEQIGSQLMAVWNMPEEVITALRHQKDSNYEGDHKEFANLLCLTEQLLTKYGVTPGVHTGVSQNLLAQFHLTEEEACQPFETLLENQSEVSSMANVMGR